VSDYELVFLDADETIFDFKRAESYAVGQAFDQFGLELTQRAALDYEEINKGLWRIFEKGEMEQEFLKVERFRLLFLRLGADVDARLFSEAYIEWLSRASFLIEGAEDLCRYLSGKYKLAVITNGIKKVQDSRIGKSAIRKYLSALVISEEAKSSKPSGGIFDYACRLLSFHDKKKMIIVGDSLSSDIKGGIDYGIDTCWANLASLKNESGLVPTYEIRSLEELRRIL